MGKYDGKVTISTAIDNSDVEKDFQEISGEFGGLKKVLNDISKLISKSMSKPVGEACAKIKKDVDAAQKKVEQYQRQIQKAESAKMPLVEQAKQLGVELDEAKAKLADLQSQQQAAGEILTGNGNAEAYIDAYAQKPQLDADVAQQQAKVDALQKQWDAVNDKVDGYNIKIDQANKEMAAQKSTVAELKKKLDTAEKETKQIRRNVTGSKKEFGAMGKAVDSFTSRLKGIALGALLFNGISAGLREFTSYLSNTLKTNKAFTTELSRLKGALLTAFQPIYNAVAPAVTYLIRLLASAALAVAEFFASITGTTVEANAEAARGLYEEASALGAVGKAAKKAGKSVAGFDELNVLQSKTDASGSSGGSDTIAPDFSPGLWNTGELEKIKEAFKIIAEYIGVAAAGLIGFKLGKFITDLLTANIEAKTLKETLALLGKKAGLTLGITLAVTGLSLEIKGISDAVQEGLNGINFAEILGGGGMLAGGGALIGQFFGSAILGGAIGGIVAGIPAFVVGIYDAIVGGIDWLSAALTAVGGAAAGAGVAVILTELGTAVAPGIGTLIGLAVGLLTDLIILIVQNWESISAWFSEVFAVIGQWFADLWQGIVDIWGVCAEWFNTTVIQPIAGFFSGLWEGISTAASTCWNAIVEFFSPAIEWFSELFGSVSQMLADIFYNIGVIANGCWEIITAVWGIVSEWFDTNIIQPVAGFFSDLWAGISNWAIGAWENIKSVFSTIGSWINANIIQPVSNFFSGLWNGFLEKARAAWEGVKSVFGKVASFFSDTFKKAWEGIVKVFSIAGDIFNDIKDGILTAFKSIVNGIIKGLNSALAVPFNGINWALNKIKNIEIVGITPFSGLKTISVPQIPYLAQGAVLPPNKPFMAVVGDQKSGVNVEAPLATIQEAVALVMQDQTQAILAGFEASVGVQREILEAVLGISIGDDVIGNAVARYNRKQAVVRGGAL